MTTESEHIAKFKCRTVTAEDLPLWVKETLLLTEAELNSSFESDLRSFVIDKSSEDRRLIKCVWDEELGGRVVTFVEWPPWAKEKLSKILDPNDSDDSNSPEDVEMTGEIERINLPMTI